MPTSLPYPPLAFISASLPPTQGRAGGSQPRPRDLDVRLVPRTGTHLRRGSPASSSRAHCASCPIHKSLHDALPSPLVCSHPKEQGLNPSPASYYLGDPGQNDSTIPSLGPWVQNRQIISQAYHNLIPVKISYGKTPSAIAWLEIVCNVSQTLNYNRTTRGSKIYFILANPFHFNKAF